MNKRGYIRIMIALVNLMVIIMVEAGKVAEKTAQTIGNNVLKALTGGTDS